jgi:hypothetical protein
MASIFENVRTDEQYRAACGLGIDKFEELFTYFDKIYKPKPEVTYRNEKLPVLTNTKEALFFILYHLKTGVTYQVLGLSFGISNASAKNYVDRIKPYLKVCLEKLNCMPSSLFKDQASFDKTFDGVTDLVIDCTEIPVQRAHEYESQKEFYSGKKKHIL